MSITTGYTEPGVYSQFKPQTSFPVLPGGLRVAALIGTGRATFVVPNEQVTRGNTPDTSDALAHDASVLGDTIVDQDGKTYTLDVDYQLTSNEVDWSLDGTASLTGTTTETFATLVGKTVKLTLNGGTEQSYTFLSGDFVDVDNATAAEVFAALNGAITGLDASASAGAVKLETSATNNASISVGAGTANTVLGFTTGSFVFGPKEPAAGKTYNIAYEYDKVSPTDFGVKFYFSMTDVLADFGDVSTSNTLSLGAEIVFQHGAAAVALVQLNPDDGSSIAQFTAAIDKLAAVKGINIVVPLSTDTAVFAYLETSVDGSSSLMERKERTGIVGMADGTTANTFISTANGLDDKRMMLVATSAGPTRFVGTDTSTTVLNGSYLAAAIAGIRTSTAFDVAEPLTHKEIVGFDDVPDTFLRAQKNLLASAGITIIENSGGLFRVRHGLTTDPSTVENREYSVVETIDFVAVSMRAILEAIFIGKKILADTPSQIRSTINAVLADLVGREVLTAFKDIQATVDGGDATQINVSFKISPVFPLNYILVTFSL